MRRLRGQNVMVLRTDRQALYIYAESQWINVLVTTARKTHTQKKRNASIQYSATQYVTTCSWRGGGEGECKDRLHWVSVAVMMSSSSVSVSSCWCLRGPEGPQTLTGNMNPYPSLINHHRCTLEQHTSPELLRWNSDGDVYSSIVNGRYAFSFSLLIHLNKLWLIYLLIYCFPPLKSVVRWL